MNKLQQMWSRLGRGARWRFIGGCVLVLGLTAWFAAQTLRVDYDVLFSQLADSDAAALVERLRQLKIPYRLTGDGTTIEVPAAQVREVRLRLMSGGVPLSGNVGFEIFDKQGLGATEQSQRVSYQRALQGELARTISTLNDVKQARVNLVLPESTLFKRDRQEARAAVTLTMKAGATLSHEQILGVQRLVAASVAGLEPGKVVVTDQRGITLSGPDSLDGSAGELTEARLAMKRDIEEYVTRKVSHMLDSTYGPGQAIVSADISLNFDEIHRTVQELEPSAVRRKRQVFAGNPPADATADAAPADPVADSTARAANPATNSRSSSLDIEYEYGRKVEQVIAAPGSVARISIGVVVPGELTSEKQQRITDLVRMAAGVNEQRGDAIVVQTLDQIGGKLASEPKSAAGAPDLEPPVSASHERVAAVQPLRMPQGVLAWSILGVVMAVLALLLATRQRLRARARALEGGRPLSPADRQSLLLEIEKALSEDGSVARAGQKI